MTAPDSIRTRPFAASILETPGRVTLAHVPDGFDAVAATDLARARGAGSLLLFVVRDAQRLAAFRNAAAFFAPDVEILPFPAWDCLPYDRVSPNGEVVAQRLATLSRLSHRQESDGPVIIATTVNAVTQRVPPRDWVAASSWTLKPGNQVDMDGLVAWLARDGFERTGTVRETGEFAVRGGILDLFPPGRPEPIRLDFFGDTLESIRSFDPETQRTTAQEKGLSLIPMSELRLDEAAISRFRSRYVARFGVPSTDDPLYSAVSEGRRHQGMEHWLPLFHERMETLFDYIGETPLLLDALIEEARIERRDHIADYHEARVEALELPDGDSAPYKPLDPSDLYVLDEDWSATLASRAVAALTPFDVPETAETGPVFDLGAREGRNFAPERTDHAESLFDAAAKHAGALSSPDRRVIVACWSEGSRDRMGDMLADHGLEGLAVADDWPDAQKLQPGRVALTVLGIERGFEAPSFVVIGEQDILGDRFVRPKRKSKRAADFLTELTSLSPGDYVVHVDHGIGRFIGLQTITAAGAPHDCLELHYHGGDKLFLPVENIELLSRYGSEDATAQLDKLGGHGWQARKAKMKERLREMAEALIRIAAARTMRPAPVMTTPEGAFEEFCARFPYEETEDQEQAITAVLEDLASGNPMDRLVCGDVGFGKTEVALRAAFVAALSGRQVAVVVPTTLLARQHYKTFVERFRGFPVNIGQASRLATSKELGETKKGLKSGDIDIVIGTHALLGKSVTFRDLGLVIVDEEQHFGVSHKERLKDLRAEIHVLTLTATPIPRTLQLALTGIRELSIIATPPVDRLAVRTFVTPFDAVVLREAILREHYRGGQTFFVCPRISDLEENAAFLRESVPEVKVAVAHGQMPPAQLDDIMGAFYDGRYDVLLSTAIVESGLDVPTANTLIVHRADMFGLSQLYQLRGRVGRSKARAYAYFSVPAKRKLTAGAEKRLKVLQSLDTLGAGFMLASHDLDIRGAGNLLGEEQSGHIREVGYELYQSMLEEAVASLKEGGEVEEGQWSPQITLGTPVLIPDYYVPDLDVRLGLYRRLSQLSDELEVESFGAELADRFGRLPTEADQLLDVVRVKILCRDAGIDRLEAGPKGLVIGLRNNRFANPQGLVQFVGEEGHRAKIRSDHTIVLLRDWATPEDRLRGTTTILRRIVSLVETTENAA
ncbi:transcription-repair coupling factor [Microbaculum marinisediminis]|uniref:Transcription-repair-coupling factor n=1 Tax=Microbaculum marinisediminis TaxID=2931392 RepID=A0AAW5R5X8_9HYPH|nr:transcription-repair coupling factor [Microbaculum sp. A6E488]MCT8974083.1 transcription-repair coupling factor [Microbaculum sp. A6E488]